MENEKKLVNIIISDELKEILLEIQDSVVAKLLLKEYHNPEELVSEPVNFISISKKDLTKISYLPKERYEGLSIEDCWATTKRIMAKPGGFVSKVFVGISEKEIEKFSTLFRNEITKPKLNFKVVCGDDIKKYYHYSSYSEVSSGSLHASCMKYDGCQRYLDIYSEYPDFCKMVVLYDNDYQNRIVGRALLWNFDGNRIMDRIYTISDETYQFYFKQWATKNDYFYKSEQNWFNTKSFEKLNGEKVKLDLVIKLPGVNNLDYTPYMDTFKFMDRDGNLYNTQPKGKDYWTLTTTDGRKHGYDYLVTDILDDVLRYRHDACYLRYLEAWTSPNNCKYSNILDTYILERDCVYNDELRDYIFNDDNKSQNDNERINSQLEYIREERREREERDSRRRVERSERDRLRSENITERTAQPIDVIDALSDIFGNDHLSIGRIGMFDAYRIVMRSIDRLPNDSRIRIEFSHVVLDDFNSLPRESRTREELERIISETTLLYMNV
jgi:hypothetical protein